MREGRGEGQSYFAEIRNVELRTLNFEPARRAPSTDSLSLSSTPFLSLSSGPECLPGKHSRTFFHFSDEFAEADVAERPCDGSRAAFSPRTGAPSASPEGTIL